MHFNVLICSMGVVKVALHLATHLDSPRLTPTTASYYDQMSMCSKKLLRRGALCCSRFTD
jgi:hypothetical protein